MHFSLEELNHQPVQPTQPLNVPVQHPQPVQPSETPAPAEKREAANPNAYIAVDLDGTLATYDSWQGWDHIGAPVPEMVRRIKLWLNLGIHVKVLTARASKVSTELSKTTPDKVRTVIEKWTEDNIGVKLEVITEKDANMLFLVDDSVVQVVKNKGEPVGGDDAFKVFEDRIKENVTNVSLLPGEKKTPELKEEKEQTPSEPATDA